MARGGRSRSHARGPAAPKVTPSRRLPGRRARPHLNRTLTAMIKKFALGLFGLIVVVALIGAVASPSTETQNASAAPAPQSAAAPQSHITVTGGKPGDVTPTATDEAKAPKAHNAPEAHAAMTAGQRNAVKSAETYLDGPLAFSKSGLIKQLKFEGFSRSDATYAVTHVRVNWNQQAVKSARTYLDGPMAFSRSGLVQQLKFEGFTQAQAEYGVSKAYH